MPHMIQNTLSVNKDKRSLNEWSPHDLAEPFVHSSVNFCDKMDTHNAVLDYGATITGTTGISGHALDQLKDHNFDTYWQADPNVAEGSQYFEAELDDAVHADSCIMNFHKPQTYRTAPYTPNPECWKAWTLKGRLESGDSWTTLIAETANTVKFYEGTFTRGEYKYFRVEGISAYDDVSQNNQIDAYLYNFGLYDGTRKYHDRFPDDVRGRNDHDSSPENTNYTDHDIYITQIDWTIGDVHDLNGDVSKVIKGETVRRYRHIGGIWSEYHECPVLIDYPQALKMTRLNSIDFAANSGICLYMFPPPDELWWFVNSAYAFDETDANMNTPIVLKVPDSVFEVDPAWTTIRSYDSFSVLGARYKDTLSGEFKVNLHYLTFSDPINMESQIRFDGQAGKGLIADMNGTALTAATNASSNVNVVRLKIGDLWRGFQGSIEFSPPIKLDGDVAADTFEYRKDEEVKGSVFRYVLYGFKMPKPEE